MKPIWAASTMTCLINKYTTSATVSNSEFKEMKISIFEVFIQACTKKCYAELCIQSAKNCAHISSENNAPTGHPLWKILEACVT